MGHRARAIFVSPTLPLLDDTHSSSYERVPAAMDTMATTNALLSSSELAVLIPISWARSTYVHSISVTVQALERVIHLVLGCSKKIWPHAMCTLRPGARYSASSREQYELNRKDSRMFLMTIDAPLSFAQRLLIVVMQNLAKVVWNISSTAVLKRSQIHWLYYLNSSSPARRRS